MTHRSWAHEQVAPRAQHDARNLHNEALEFLGDSILGLIVADEESERDARARLGSGAIRFHRVPHQDLWLRDSGPIFVIGEGGRRAGVHFGFNAWGEKFHPYDRDAAIGGRLVELVGDPCYRAPLVLEGGSICVDGEGTLITTEQCLLHPSRNPSLSREQIEQQLRDQLGLGAHAAEGGGSAVAEAQLTTDPAEAVAGAHAVYTDVWVSMGDEETAGERRAALAPYRIDDALLDQAADGAIALHCLPAHPGEEITAEVLYGERQRIWDQAENRRHAQKALLELLVS